jgi:hypothetical protein
VAIEPRQFDRRFVRLAAGIAEERLVHTGKPRQAFGQLLLLDHPIQIRDVDQAMHLSFERRREAGVIVTKGIDRDAGDAIEVALPMLVEEAATFAMGEGDGLPGIVVHQVRHVPLRGCKQGNVIRKKRRRPVRPRCFLTAGNRS